MLTKIKKNCANFLRHILPTKLYRLIANGAIVVPKYYKSILEEAEKNFGYTLEDTDDRTLLLMRKYAHILDKGLHRQDLQPGHSKTYYDLLLKSVNRLKNSQYSNDPTLLWAESKLRIYEEVQTGKSTPLKGTEPKLNITFEDFQEIFKSRRSNRNFKTEVVPSYIIDKLKDAANWASSSCNKQPIEIYTTNNPGTAAECLRCCKGGTGFSEFIPSFWVFTANVRGYIWPSEMFLPYIDVSLGAQNVFLGATTFGLSGTILSWAQKSYEEEESLKKLLKIPDHHQIIFCAVIGYAKTCFQTPTRKHV